MAELTKFVKDGRNVKFFKFGDEVVNTTSDQTDMSHLREDVDAETPANAVDDASMREVRPSCVVINFAVSFVHHREDQAIHFFIVDRTAIQGAQRAFDSDVRRAVNLEMKVAARKLYKGFDSDYPKYMTELCANADIITPNITEAALMLGIKYREGPYTEDFINSLLEGLYLKTHAKIVLTGVYYDNRRIGAAVYDGEKKEYVFSERISASYHGTGDVFASTLTAALLNGRSLKAAAQIAVNFTCACIKRTAENDTDMRYGVNFESQIPNLIKYLEL